MSDLKKEEFSAEEHHHDHCSCGHDHSHEEHGHHHEECACGHEHSHGDHKHHHEECACGHEHSHEEHEHRQENRCNTCGQPLDACTCPAAKGMKRKIYLLENLGCAHCASKMEEQISRLEGVAEATITFATRQLRVTAKDPDQYLPEIRRICTSIESEVKVLERSAAPAAPGKTSPHARAAADDHTSGERTELIGILLGAGFFAAAVLLEYTEQGSFFTLAVFLAAYLILGGKVLLEAGRNILHGQIFDENFLMSLATLGAFAIQEYPEAVGVMLFYRVGEYFEHRAVERSRGQIMEAVDMRPEVVSLYTENEIRIIPAGEALPGDLLLIRPGDRIPLDGVVVEGSSRLDTSPITGEPVPVSVSSGDRITSGCVNTSGELKMQVERPLEESMVTRILDSVENAAASKPKIDRFITRFSKIYTPFVVLMALATAVIPSLISGNWNYWIYTALTFLVMSCPCALVLSVPLAFFSGIGAGSKKKILFKGGVAMESLSHLGAVVLDKTGTITEGNFRLQKIVSIGTRTEEELLRICAGCEQHSTHPIGISIVNAAREQGLKLDTPSSLEEIAGHGIFAGMPDGNVLCGNRKLMEKYRIPLPEEAEASYGAEVFLAVNGKAEGYFLISDTVKEDAKAAIRRLKSMGLYTVMLTGDSQAGAEAAAKATGIDEVHAKLLPQDKLEILGRIREKHGLVMFVGDGINDAPVLAGADVGAAMGSGADAAIEAADAVFMTSCVEAVPQSISIARSAGRIALQNVVFALVIKAAVMILGLLGFANMWMAVFADTGVAMLCVLNSIRILYRK